ncbi:MAG: esterase [Candidatus Dactylopiibacterium carminicum]|uniref:Esterase n=1 Tax=Candidatus Dactylopiibacterium carminicum TaxID=857335 RepID=A0A272EMV2_9RHOO|nr:alpha/beta hydrolase-fold protein [Candidatus Dactylopiibacterium carminicum]KAF7597845.1 esterase [Candidatus Dactylopiibacterium carminicum]PAS91435.1 MAG: esterase [Candidatus Dactylopiibacterium carminicum]PAS92577.1 MAG: esterase [Candidatus Dactylopiibacterium carminicum]PAS95711.1 MAG: hypothetical protein BSR46_16560 [Candidatus Dactylopiibacterium carminicum]
MPSLQRILLLLSLFLLMPIAHAEGPSFLSRLPAEWSPAQLARSASFEIESRHTGQRYRVLLGIPFSAAPKAGYPVLWALDGLASFPTMEAFRPRQPREQTRVADAWRERAAGQVRDGLIVAVGYASGEPFNVDARALDYTPEPQAPTGDLLSPRHGGAEAFLAFLTEELRPLLAEYFPMDPQRHTLFGFSYGALFTLHTLSTQPQYFQRYWAASPSLWFADHQTIKALPQRLKALDFAAAPVRVTITVGRDEQYPEQFASANIREQLQVRTMVDNVHRFAQLLQEKPGTQVTTFDLPGSDHYDMLQHGARHVLAFAFAP